MIGLEAFVNLEDVNIPIDEHNLLEYNISPYCSLIYDFTENREYISYIDLATGEEYEEEIEGFTPRAINGTMIDEIDIKEFYAIKAMALTTNTEFKKTYEVED